MKVFISGPMTGYENWNKEAFDLAEAFLRDLDFDVFNPAWMLFTDGWSHDDIMTIDLAALDKCDAILQLNGWENSTGAMEEYRYARKTGKQIFIPMYNNKGQFTRLMQVGVISGVTV